MKVLGLDISSQCTGWAVISDGKLVKYGDIDISKYKIKDRIDDQMFSEYAGRIKELILLHKPNVVAVENVYVNTKVPSGKNIRTAQALFGMSAISRAIAFKVTNRPILTVFPSQVNALFGIGNPRRALRKPLIVKNINKLYKLKLLVEEDDIADAIGIAHVGYRTTQGLDVAKYF